MIAIPISDSRLSRASEHQGLFVDSELPRWQYDCHMGTRVVGGSEAVPSPRLSLRAEQRNATQERILSALAELANEGHSTEVAMSTVAERAGVGERTLYRHFPSKNELFDALFAWVTSGLRELESPESPDELIARMRDFFASYARHPEVIRALGANQVGNDMREQRAGRRRAYVESALMPVTEHQDRVEQQRFVAIVHMLSSSTAYLHLYDNYGFDADEAADAVAWAIRRLVGEAASAPLAADETRHT